MSHDTKPAPTLSADALSRRPVMQCAGCGPHGNEYQTNASKRRDILSKDNAEDYGTGVRAPGSSGIPLTGALPIGMD